MERRQVDVVVMSDLHLGTYGCHAKEIVNYLKSIQPRILVLNGDVIDIWQFNKRYFPVAHMQVFKEIMNLLSKGTRVIYITGNHDEVLRRYSDLEMGNFHLTDKVVMEKGSSIGFLKGDLLHYTVTSIEQFKKQQEKFDSQNKLRQYEQVFSRAIQVEYPLSSHIRDSLSGLQQSLQLTQII